MMPETPVVLIDLPSNVRGFVCLGSDYEPCVVINARMTKEQQMKTYKHEMNHIMNGNMDDGDYLEYGDPA